MPATTAFVEVRFSDLFAAPLVSRGELSFTAVDRLGKRIDSPFKESTQIKGESVRIERSGRKPMQFSLKRAPELRALLAGFAGMLAGDIKILQRYFKVTTAGGDARWQIALDPLDARMKKRVVGVLVIGSDNAPRCFRVEEADGDLSLMLVGTAATEPLPQPLTEALVLALCRETKG